MTPEERRAKDREYYRLHREEIKAKQRERYNKEYKREWRKKNHDEQVAKERERYRRYNTEEYRAERRRKYAEKHKDDPMTEHRRKCIEAAQKRTKTPLEDRKARIAAEKAAEAAKEDIRDTYQQAEEESIRKHETVVKYIDKWTKRKIFATTTEKNGEFMSEADVRAYYREAVRYFEIEKRLRDTPPTDYTTRNILSYKMRVIEEHFNALLNKRYATKSKIQNAL